MGPTLTELFVSQPYSLDAAVTPAGPALGEWKLKKAGGGLGRMEQLKRRRRMFNVL